jgi:hypothetical protein
MKTATPTERTTRIDAATSPRNCGTARRPTTISSGGAKPARAPASDEASPGAAPEASRERRASSALRARRQSIADQIDTHA